MTPDEIFKAPHAVPQPVVPMVRARIQMLGAYRLKAIQDGREDLRASYESQVRVLRGEA